LINERYIGRHIEDNDVLLEGKTQLRDFQKIGEDGEERFVREMGLLPALIIL
jgi:hypothetical protein